MTSRRGGTIMQQCVLSRVKQPLLRHDSLFLFICVARSSGAYFVGFSFDK